MKKEKRTGRWETKAPPAGPGARLRILAYQSEHSPTNQRLEGASFGFAPMTTCPWRRVFQSFLFEPLRFMMQKAVNSICISYFENADSGH